MGEEKARRGLISEGMVNALGVVKAEEACGGVQEQGRLTDRICMHLDKLFGKSPLVAFDAAVGEVTRFGLIRVWACEGGEIPGVWVSGQAINIGQILDQPLYSPFWDYKDHPLWFFSRSETGTDHYAATFDAYCSDAVLVAHLNGVVGRIAWAGQFTW